MSLHVNREQERQRERETEREREREREGEGERASFGHFNDESDKRKAGVFCFLGSQITRKRILNFHVHNIRLPWPFEGADHWGLCALQPHTLGQDWDVWPCQLSKCMDL